MSWCGATPGVELPDLPEPSGPERDQAVAALLPYLMSHRSRLAALQAHDPTLAASVEDGAVETSPDAQNVSALAASTGLTQELWSAAACAVDTAILKVCAVLSAISRPVHALPGREGCCYNLYLVVLCAPGWACW